MNEKIKQIPTNAQIVIIGGGIAGCSLAYHLAKLGLQDIVLLERKQLTCGTTWHAAGLIAQLRATKNMTKLAKYSQELYGKLEEETGIATGFRRCGSITVALTKHRLEEIKRQAGMARAFDVEIENISAQQVKEKYPHLNCNDVLGGVFLPKDGQGDPANIALALAKGARQNGATIIEGVKVIDIKTNNGKIENIKWQRDNSNETGTIKTAMIANCAGMWAREIGKKANVAVPLHAAEHFYIVSEAIENLTQLPVLRVPDECAYYKEDAGKIMLGAFERNAKPWGQNGIDDNFCFDQLPEDFEHFEPILEMATKRMPLLNNVGIHTFFNGPESFTPDNAYHLGEAPNLTGFFICAGFNSVGIQSAGGAGWALAHWIKHGHPPFDLHDVDIRRTQNFQNNKHYLYSRIKESLGLLYDDHFPYRQFATARGIRRTPFYNQLKQHKAVFGEMAGWERANWFANEGEEKKYKYSWQRQNWFNNSAQEHKAIRENIGMYDMSSFGKIKIEGPDAQKFLNYICANDIDVAINKIVYTQFLNERGGIEADVTITRLCENCFYIVTPAATLQRELAWLNKHKKNYQVIINDFTASEAVLAIMGPNTRQLLQTISSHNFSNENHPFGTAQNIELGMGLARAHRISYVGELGYEIYIQSDMAEHIFETIMQAGQNFNLKLCGMHAMDSLRIEKAFRHFGHDITQEDHVLEAGLGFAVKTNKENFIGKNAVLTKKQAGLKTTMIQFLLNEPEPLLYHNEPILRNGEIVSYITSGNYGHTLGAAVGLGYVPCENESTAQILDSNYEIEIAGTKIKAKPSLAPLYDAKNERMKL